MKEFHDIVFGALTFGSFLGYAVLMAIGVIAHLCLDVMNRDVKSTNTPEKFSLKFMIRDNYKRFLGVFAVMYICLRFSDKMFDAEPVDWMMVAIGYNIDSVITFAKNKTSVMQSDRLKLMTPSE